MTESEAIEVLNNFDMQVSAKADGAYQSTIGETACKVAVKALSEIQQYRAIGTVEECREAMERQRAKKPIKVDSGVYDYDFDYECPNCKENIDEDEHHCKCGQAIDWGDTD